MRVPKRCLDLTDDHINDGLKSVESMRVLLEHMARIAKPNEGAAKILVAISRIATTACDWLEGNLHVAVDEVVGAAEIEVSSDLGGGVRELLFPRLLLAVEQDELVRAVKLAPRLITPLKFRIRDDRMILRCDSAGTVAPPAFEIAEESLRRSLPPKVRRSLAPIATATRTKEEPTVEGVILARLLPKASKALVVDELPNVNVGWDSGAYSSTIDTRETKPPPARTTSKRPTQAPPRPLAPAKRPVLRKVADRPVGRKPKPKG